MNMDSKSEEAVAPEILHLDQVNTNIDVVNLSTKSPYLEVNFIGTYIAIILGAVCSYGGFVMPITSLAFINADIGMLNNSFHLCVESDCCLFIDTVL